MQETIPDSYAKWPQQVSLNNLAMTGLLINPQTEIPIKTQQDFQAAIPATGQSLLALFQGDAQFLPTLWDYNSTYNSLLTCSTANTNSIPVSTCSAHSSNCAINPQNFQYSSIWPVLGPILLATISQQLQDHQNQLIDAYGIYGRLLLQNHCSVAALAQTLRLNGQSIQLNQAYQLEQDALVQIAIANSSNSQLLTALIWAASQTSNQQLDNWFSAAIITNPINPNAPPMSAQPTTSAQPTSAPPTTSAQPMSAPPTTSAQPTTSLQQPPSNVSVGPASLSQSIIIVNIIKKNGDISFDPPIVRIPKGTTVIWVNNTDASQTVTTDSDTFTPIKLPPNQKSSTAFPNTGNFTFQCKDHASSQATVIVIP